MFLRIIVKEIRIQTVLKIIRVGKDFFILDQIKSDDVNNVKKCNHHISVWNIRPGIIINAFDIHAENSIIL
jgi:hypothetical protein